MKKKIFLNKNGFKIFIFLLVFLCLLALRRWVQLISPQVWDEDGTKCIPEFISSGWFFLLKPVNGYFITLPKIITAISLTISFVHYPIVSTIISWIFIALVGLAVTLSPTNLKGKFLCAILIFLIPSDPEVFGLPLYTFWFSSILLFLLPLWDVKNHKLVLRLLYLLIGGLSSTVIFLILPLLYFRVFKNHKIRSEWVIALTATLITIIQLYAVIKGISFSKELPSFFIMITYIITKFFGNFLVGNLLKSNAILFFIGALLFFTIVINTIKYKNSFVFLILIYLLFGSILTTIARTGFIDIHPVFAGPRYFFFPFILFFWILVQILYSTNFFINKVFIGIIIIIAVINEIPARERKNTDNLYWVNNVRECRLYSSYIIPIQFNGDKDLAWGLKMSGDDCTRLHDHDFLSKIKNTFNKVKL